MQLSTTRVCCYQTTRMQSNSKYLGLNINNMNPNFNNIEFEIIGPLEIRFSEIAKELAAGKKKPFTELMRPNIGDAHAMGQKPITYLRQTLAVCFDQSLLKSSNMPEEVKERAKLLLQNCLGGSLGAYTETAGVRFIRRQVAEFIKNRDGCDCSWENIYLSTGASSAIRSVLSLLNCKVGGKAPGIMIPIPQYPLYTATLAEYGMKQIHYFLDEDSNWSLKIDELQRAIDEARETTAARAIVVINPGNPTGQVLTLENIEAIIRFAHREKLVLLADEVYQHNIYDENSKFYSFKKVLMSMGAPYNELELASFMSISKGYLGECGIRGGFMELVNFDPEVKAMLQKSVTPISCPTTAGQIAVSALVNPPKEGESIYDLYIKERHSILDSLAEKAELVHTFLNGLDGLSCNVAQGALYAFPQIKMPPKAIETAKKQGVHPDFMYALELLETKGIYIAPGSAFKQRSGTYHFRITILPPKEKLTIILNRIKEFQIFFMEKYK